MDIRSMAEIALVVLSTLMLNRLFWTGWYMLTCRSDAAYNFEQTIRRLTDQEVF